MYKEMEAQLKNSKDSPAYVFHLDKLTERVKLIQEKLYGLADLCYAIKANPFLLSPLRTEVCKYEVCSPGEFSICEREGIPMKHIVLSGVSKERADLEYVLDTYGGTGIYTAESQQQLMLLSECAAVRKCKLGVLLRVTGGNQFGIDEKGIIEILTNRSQYPALDIKGLQFYSGTQKKKMQVIQKEVSYLDDLCMRLKEQCGYEVQELEYGPGLYVPYFEHKKEDSYSQKGTRHPESAPSDILDTLAGMLKNMKYQGRIVLEMGRFVAAECGSYFTKIVDLKENQGQSYAIVDGGIHHVNYYGQTMAMKHPKIIHIHTTPVPGDQTEAHSVHICGSLCTVGDVLIKKFPLQNPRIGDILVFEKMGAYSVTEGIYLFLSRKLPKIYFYTKDTGLKLVRDSLPTDHINSAI